MVEMNYVDSSNIESIGYDNENQDLHVHFVNGGIYVYHQVPHNIFDEIMNADSKGSYLNREVKGIYEFSKG